MKKIINMLCLLLATQAILAQGNWDPVGPKSDNQENGNGFETSQLNNITVDPNNHQHLFASGWYGGLWESTNRGANWSPINNSVTGLNGVSAVTFLSSTEILVANFHPRPPFGYDNSGAHHYYSTGIWKYNFSTHGWLALGALPNPSGLPFGIRSIAVYPNN
ncbi:MAG: hypothetical protein H0W84_03945, partial [Bacteroidetes bacterium]|nr:hypothetical protein [Bacteroidota bacterium]